jgi:hypothetical protein
MNAMVPIPAKRQLNPHEVSFSKALIVMDIPMKKNISNDTLIVNARKFAINTL